MFDIGRVAGEIQHAFVSATGKPDRAEPFIGHFPWEYCCHFPVCEPDYHIADHRELLQIMGIGD